MFMNDYVFLYVYHYDYILFILYRSVRVSKGTLDGSPSLTVSWIAVSESGVTYLCGILQIVVQQNHHLEHQNCQEILVHQPH